MILMHAPGEATVVDWCEGPDREGQCPRVPAGDQVPCCGLELTLADEKLFGVRHPRIPVRPGVRACPLAELILSPDLVAREYQSPVA